MRTMAFGSLTAAAGDGPEAVAWPGAYQGGYTRRLKVTVFEVSVSVGLLFQI